MIDEKDAKIAMLRALGYSQTEIAEKLGIKQTVVSYRLKKIRKLVDIYGDDKVFFDIFLKSFNISSYDFLMMLLRGGSGAR